MSAVRYSHVWGRPPLPAFAWACTLAISLFGSSATGIALAGDGNRLTYLDDFTNPYYVTRDFPKLTTPQWIGNPDIELVVTLGIDDMRNNTADYERHLRPILNRLKEIDGRAPLSIMTCQVDPQDAQVRAWLAEGVNIDAHTADHPCPCLQGADFARAKRTYDQCVDQMASIEGNEPCAFRFPCMDSLNTPSPRAFAEILSRTTDQGNFLQISSSVCVLLTPQDPELPRDLVYQAPGQERFRKYLPFRNFVNVVQDYPYPFLIGKLLWEFPCGVPDDWQGQHLQGPSNPQTAQDYQAYADAVRVKQGTANFIFHPNNWLGNELMTQTVDAIHGRHGPHVKFLNFRECAAHLRTHLLRGHSVRNGHGEDNGIRLLDINYDGYLDVIIANDQLHVSRIWQPESRTWLEIPFPVGIVRTTENGHHHDNGVRFGILASSGYASFLICNSTEQGIWHFDGKAWVPSTEFWKGLEAHVAGLTTRDGVDAGVRLRDLDGNGRCEVLVSNPTVNLAFRWSDAEHTWQACPYVVPASIVDAQGRDNGVRFVDVNADLQPDVIVSNGTQYGVYLYQGPDTGWNEVAREGTRQDADAIPLIAQDGMNYGTWFADDHMWIQNEFTNQLPDGVDKVSFSQLLGATHVGPLDPQAGAASFRLPDGLRLEVVASEPLVQDPVAIDWGYDGKLWVAEMGDYPMGTDGAGAAGGRIRYLEDTDQDGHYDQSTLFLEGLHFPSGVMAWNKGVLISAAPDILYAEDTDQDGRADTTQVLYTGFAEGNQQHRVHGFARGLDNWIYLSNGHSGGHVRAILTGQESGIRGRDLRIDPRTGGMETVAGETQHNRCQDDAGNWFGGANNSVGWHYALADEQLKRNRSVKYPRLQHPISKEEQIFPSGRRLMHWEGYLAPPAGEPESASAACGYAFYRDNRLGSDYDGNFFICDATNNTVQRRVLAPEGATFTSKRIAARNDRDFLTSVDPWFRPVMARTGPDGGLWIVDMYRMVIEHPEWISDLLEQQIDVRSGHDRGRLYRITAVGQALRPVARMDRMSTMELIPTLASENGSHRDLAQQLLVDRLRDSPDPAAVGELRRRAVAGQWVTEREHALCTLDGAAQLDTETLLHALHDPHPWVRRHAYRLTGKGAKQHGDDFASMASCADSLCAQIVQETYPVACVEGAYALGELPGDMAATALWRLWRDHATDEIISAAVLSSVNPDNLAALTQAAIRDQAAQPLADLLGIAMASNSAAVLSTTVSFLEARLQSNPDSLADAFPVIATLLEAPSRGDPTVTELLKQHHNLFQHCTERAREVIANQALEVPQRSAAIAVLGYRIDQMEDDVAALTSLLEPQSPQELQQRATRALARIASPQAANALLTAWNSATPSLRRSIGESLLRRELHTQMWLESIVQGAIPASSIDVRHRHRLLTHPTSHLQELATTIWGHTTTSTRAQVISAYGEALRLPGDVIHGKLLFTKHCTACHQLDGVGQTVGSNLAELQHKSPASLLESILDPNRAVEDRFLEYVVATEDGQIWNGVLAEETSAAITLRGQDGKQQQILRAHIAEIKNLGRSFMPEGLEKDLQPQDVSDLIRYLQEQRTPPKTLPGNTPVLVQSSSSDTVELHASQCGIYGTTLVYESGYQNLGFWSSASDKAVWTLEARHGGTYEVVFEYACDENSAGNSLALELGATTISASVPSTGSWDSYEPWRIGTLQLTSGIHTLSVYPIATPQNCLIDLRKITLVRIAD